MKTRTRITIGVAIGAVALAVLWLRAKPYDDSHLMRPSVSIAARRNAYTYYCQAVDHLSGTADEEKLKDIVIEGGWDQAFVDDLLGKDRDALALVKRGNRRPRCVAPRISSFGDDCSHLIGWRNLSRRYVVRVRDDVRKELPTQALDDLTTLLVFVDRIQADAAAHIAYLSALGMQERALECSREMVWSGVLDDRHLKRLQKILAAHPPSLEGYTLALKSEYELLSNYIGDIRGGKVPVEEPIFEGMSRGKQRLAALVLLRPDRTRREIGNYLTLAIADAAKPFAANRIRELNEQMRESTPLDTSLDDLRHLRIPNTMGDFLYWSYMTSYGILARFTCKRQASHRATVAIVALHRYRLQHGEFPASLDALVPEFLEEVRRDPFDGEPLRYSAEKGIVYSVGKDLKDDGGMPEPDKSWQSATPWDLVYGVTGPVETDDVPGPE